MIHFHLFDSLHVYFVFFTLFFFPFLTLLLPFLHIEAILYHFLFSYLQLYGYSFCHHSVPSEPFPSTKSRLLPCVDIGHPVDQLLMLWHLRWCCSPGCICLPASWACPNRYSTAAGSGQEKSFNVFSQDVEPFFNPSIQVLVWLLFFPYRETCICLTL